jgi:general stress protein 26
MEVSDFSTMQEEFMRRVSQAVYCAMATVDRRSRPRSRIVHPIWDGSTGWVITDPKSHKASHLRHNPHVSLAYIADKDRPVYVDCAAEWVEDPAEKQHIWELIKATPPPLGYDPAPFFSGIDDPYFGTLRLTPWRIELYTLGGEALVWHSPGWRSSTA